MADIDVKFMKGNRATIKKAGNIYKKTKKAPASKKNK